MHPSVAIMIASHNRATELERTLSAIALLEPAPQELLITLDGCTDNSLEIVQQIAPQAKIIINQVGQGSISSRDQMLRSSQCDYVLSLDDDSYPKQRNCIDIVVRLFEQFPQAAVLHFPQHTDERPDSLNEKHFGEAYQTGSYANSGACYRRSVYLALPGFCSLFFHAYEEPDYALQCVAANWEVWYTPDLLIRHHYSGIGRNEMNVHQRHARNEIWSIWLRCPWFCGSSVWIQNSFTSSLCSFSRN